MKTNLGVVATIAFVFATSTALAADQPAWAYAIAPAPPAGAAPAAKAPAPPPDTSAKHLPGSTLEFTRAQISNGFGPADCSTGPKFPAVSCSGSPSVSHSSTTELACATGRSIHRIHSCTLGPARRGR